METGGKPDGVNVEEEINSLDAGHVYVQVADLEVVEEALRPTNGL